MRRAGRATLLFVALAAFLLPLAWTAFASFGVLPDNTTRPPSWTGPISLAHFSEIGIAEPAFWQELARICEEAKMDSIFLRIAPQERSKTSNLVSLNERWMTG